MSELREVVANHKARTEPIGEGKFGAELATFEDGTKAVLKPQQFSDEKFRGVPRDSLHRREVAAYRLDRDILGFGVVPETVLIRWKDREASLQAFVEGTHARDIIPDVFNRKLPDWKERVAKLWLTCNLDDLLKITVLDLLMNNVDRHGKNLLIDRFGDRVWAIDNSLSFAPFLSKYRSIVHKYLFLTKFKLPDDILRTLSNLKESDLEEAIGRFLPEGAITETYLRAQFIVEHAGQLDFKRLSLGHYDRNDFPSYSKWFAKKLAHKEGSAALIIGSDEVDANSHATVDPSTVG